MPPEAAVQRLVMDLVRQELARLRGGDGEHENDSMADSQDGDARVQHHGQGAALPDASAAGHTVPIQVATCKASPTTATDLWDDILTGTGRGASSELGVSLEDHMALPPPQAALKEALESLVKYDKVPRTPQARGDRQDREYQAWQSRVEASLHLLLLCADAPSWDHMGMLMAVLRSLWEDISQARRRRFAGRESWKLDKRADDDAARLLSPEEEKRVREAPKRNKGFGKSQSASRRVPSATPLQQPVLGAG